MSPPFLSTPPSCPCHSLGMSTSFSMRVPFFRCESVPYICYCPLFPFHSLCARFHFCPFHVPCRSPLFPFHFPLLSCHVDFLFPPLILLALPCISPLLPSLSRQKKLVFQRFRRQKEKEPAGGFEWDPCLATPAPRRLRLVERHQITARYVGDPAKGGFSSNFQSKEAHWKPNTSDETIHVHRAGGRLRTSSAPKRKDAICPGAG